VKAKQVMDKKLKDNVAIVTGAAKGIGLAIAERLARDGAKLVLADLDEAGLKQTCAHLSKDFGAEVASHAGDLSDQGTAEKTVNLASERFGRLDILVNNAGLAAGLDLFQDASLDDWDQMIDTNVKGLLYVTKEILPFMLKQNRGYIFNIGSTAAKYVYEKGNVYCATKSAVDALTQAMRIDLLKKNIRVTAIHPGMVETEFSQVRFKGDEEKAKTVYKGLEPLKAEDIADVIFYCASTPSHVCINELVITPTAQASPFYIDRK